MSRLRVLVVEDSLTVRRRLCDVLDADPTIQVVGEAADGKQAIELCQSLRPDVISLDMMLPILSGLAATEYIMAYAPTPILIVSSSFNRGEIFKSYEALAVGAVDLMEKPKAEDGEDEWEKNYIAKLKLVARVKVVTHLRGKKKFSGGLNRDLSGPGADLRDTVGAVGRITNAVSDMIAESATNAPLNRHAGQQKTIQLIAMGASTGGPSAIVQILRSLPPEFALPVLVVIHINEPFGTAFAEWLDLQSTHKVRIAQEGQLLNKPGIVVAPADRHLVVRNRSLHITDDPERNSCRPSVDVLFESIALEYGPNAAGCLLTGMGKDGARGLLAMHQAGGVTIAQDEASCVVYGMPREAVILGAAQRVLPLSEIGVALTLLNTQ